MDRRIWDTSFPVTRNCQNKIKLGILMKRSAGQNAWSKEGGRENQVGKADTDQMTKGSEARIKCLEFILIKLGRHGWEVQAWRDLTYVLKRGLWCK